jgi:hypothetical protein
MYYYLLVLYLMSVFDIELYKVSYVHVLVNAGKLSMWTHTLREVFECIRKK